jgi:hypothetical protein
MAQMMEDPGMQQMMQSVLSNPAMLQVWPEPLFPRVVLSCAARRRWVAMQLVCQAVSVLVCEFSL